MPIDLNELNYILEIAKTGSITRAAENLFLSQPYLSSKIKSVEKEIGVSLFHRLPRGVALTDDGKEFVQHAQKIMDQYGVMKTQYFAPSDGRIQIRISLTRSHQIIRCFSHFINQSVDSESLLLRINETGPFSVVEDVYTRSSDFGFLHCFDAQKEYFINTFRAYDLEYKEMYDRKYLLCMSEKNPLAKQDTISCSMLKDQISILYGDYESALASYKVVTKLTDITLSSKRIYVYDRASAMDLLDLCPDTYMWITGLHDHTLTSHHLVLRECEGIEDRNIGYRLSYPVSELRPHARQLMDSVENIDWTEQIIR